MPWPKSKLSSAETHPHREHREREPRKPSLGSFFIPKQHHIGNLNWHLPSPKWSHAHSNSNSNNNVTVQQVPSGSFLPPVEGGMGSGSGSGSGEKSQEKSQEKLARQSTTGPSSSSSGFADFGLKRRKSAGTGAGGATGTGTGTGTGGAGAGAGAGKARAMQEKEAVVAVSNALAGSSPLAGPSSSSPSSTSSSSAQTSSKEARERSRLSGLVGISSHDVMMNGLPLHHYQPAMPASPSYPTTSNTPVSPVAPSSSSATAAGHFGGSGGMGMSNNNNMSSLAAHGNHGSISATLHSTPTSVHGPPHASMNGGHTKANNNSNNTRANANNNVRTTPKFSTADRTILEQLLAGRKAREAQFVVKGVGHVVPGDGRSEGKKHHPYPREVVPYPRSYGREVVDLDIWETQFCMDICDSVTWHIFETPPTKVLDLGCGSGTWILHCAKQWKESQFVGLDVVPLHPDLQVVGSPDLASRITWVQHNFLDGLPFQNDEFDFVHIKRIALGVPEDKWDNLLDEIRRVMKPGGALEFIEEDLFFPGIKKDNNDDTEQTNVPDRDDGSSITRRNSVSSDQYSTDKHSLVSDFDQPPPPPPIPASAPITTSGRLPSRPASPTRHYGQAQAQASRLDVNVNEKGVEEPAGPYPNPKFASSSSVSTNLITPHSRSTARPTLLVKTPKGSSSGNSYSDMAANQSIYGSNVGILGAMGYMASEDPLMALIKEQKMQKAASAAASASVVSGFPSQKGPTLSKSRVDPHGRSMSKTVTDPRDHTMLEAIWNGMLETRFVNRTPLSMLTTFLEYHFSDVRTHPPLLYSFPISHPTEYWDSDPDSDSDSDSDEEEEDEPYTPLHHDSDPDVDEARDAIVPRPHSVKSNQPSGASATGVTAAQQRQWSVFDEESPWIDLQKRLEICYPFITLDGSRVWSKLSPHSGATLPNTRLRIDTKSLNQHLALRAKEIIACSESMWEWVLERQAKAEKEAAQGVRNRSGSASIETYMVGVPSSATDSSLDLTQNAILEMTRDDFNHLMNNFHLDMEDKASLGFAIQRQFDWHVFKSHVTQDRKAFNKGCRKYNRWVARTIRRAKRTATNPYRHTANHQSRNSMSASAPGLVLPASELTVPHDYNLIARSSSTPQPSTGDYQTDDNISVATAVNSRQDLKSSQPHLPPAPVLPTFSLSQLPPEQRQSRSIRVFVAWKAS